MLPPIPAPRETVQVGGVAVSVRGLTLGEVQALDALGNTDAEATGIQAVAWGCDVGFDEAKTWIEAISPQFGAQVAEHIMRLSGMTEAVGARFPAGVHGGNGGHRSVRVGRSAAKNTTGDQGHAPS